jgi:hypothetical protein
MNAPLIWLHEEALRITHPVFRAAPVDTKAIYIWDDTFLRRANYSLKRLVFIYETLCELPIDIIQGDTMSVIYELKPSDLCVPAAHNPLLIERISRVASAFKVTHVVDDVFAYIKGTADTKRFFQYWNKAEKTAFHYNGGADAQRG